MTTVLTATRLWESDDSVESIANQYRNPLSKGSQNSRKQKDNIVKDLQRQFRSQNISFNKKSGKLISRTNLLAVPKRCSGDQNLQLATETNGVKKSALLYEITERTNRLARPKAAANAPGPQQPSRVSLPTTRTLSRLNERVSELSRPKSYYNPPDKPPGYIAPSALRAVATKRILELATPRKTKSPRLQKRNAIIYGPCSSRISYLARPKYPVNSKTRQTNYLRRSHPSKIHPPPWRFPETKVWKELGYSSNVVKSSQKEDNRSKRRPKKIERKSRSSRLVEPSQSDCSVFSFTVHKSPKLVRCKKRSLRVKTGRIKRKNYSINKRRGIKID